MSLKWFFGVVLFHAKESLCRIFHQRFWNSQGLPFNWRDANGEKYFYCEKCKEVRYEFELDFRKLLFKK